MVSRLLERWSSCTRRVLAGPPAILVICLNGIVSPWESALISVPRVWHCSCHSNPLLRREEIREHSIINESDPGSRSQIRSGIDEGSWLWNSIASTRPRIGESWEWSCVGHVMCGFPYDFHCCLSSILMTHMYVALVAWG